MKIASTIRSVSLLIVLAGSILHAQPTEDSIPDIPEAWDTYYVMLILPGADSVQHQSAEEVRTVMLDHIRYQLRLQRDSIALAAGGFDPRTSSTDPVGMTLLRVESIEDARRIAAEDPAVKAGRFSVSVYAWYVPAGRLP
jgi:hypothetical protein